MQAKEIVFKQQNEDLAPVKCIYAPPPTHTPPVAKAAVRSNAVVLLC